MSFRAPLLLNKYAICACPNMYLDARLVDGTLLAISWERGNPAKSFLFISVFAADMYIIGICTTVWRLPIKHNAFRKKNIFVQQIQGLVCTKSQRCVRQYHISQVVPHTLPSSLYLRRDSYIVVTCTWSKILGTFHTCTFSRHFP